MPSAERLADEVEALNARGEGALERGLHEWVVVGAKLPADCPLACLFDRRYVENVRIVFDEILQQPRKLRRVRRIVHVLNPSGQRQHLPLV